MRAESWLRRFGTQRLAPRKSRTSSYWWLLNGECDRTSFWRQPNDGMRGKMRTVRLHWHHTKRTGLDKWCTWFGPIQATDWAKLVPSNRLQTADLPRLCSQWRRGSRPTTSPLCLNYIGDNRHLQGILVIASFFEGQYHPQTPPRVSQFRNLVRRFKGHRRQLRSARSRTAAKAGKAGRIRRVKIPGFWSQFQAGISESPITSAGALKIHLNEVICKGLHHRVEYKLDWSSIQQSKYEGWDNHIPEAAKAKVFSFLLLKWNIWVHWGYDRISSDTPCSE